MGGIEEPDEQLDLGRDSRWRPPAGARLAVLLVVGALAATLIYLITKPDHPSTRAAPGTTNSGRSPSATHSSRSGASLSTSTAALTETAGDCLVTRAPANARPPAAVHYSPPPSVLWVKDGYGNGSLWVMLPPDGRLPTDPHADGSVSTRLPFFRVKPGQVRVHGQRLDGPPGRFSADVGTVDAYGNSGFVPSELSFSTPGCWRLRASVSGSAALTFTVLVNSPVVSRGELARPLRLPKLRRGQACPVSGGTPITAAGAIGFGGIAQGAGPVRPLVGNRNGVARLVSATTHRGWLAAKTLWFSAPGYQGPYLVRARRLDGTGPVGLLEDPHRNSFLVQAGPTINEAGGYRETTGGTWMKRPGCVGWQIDGLNFSRIIVVRFTH